MGEYISFQSWKCSYTHSTGNMDSVKILKAMDDEIKIQALCKLNDSVFPCSGYIKVLWVKNNEGYISWQMFDAGGNNIAGVSRRYYLNSQPLNKDKIIEMAFANIEKFRIGRKRIFSDIRKAKT